MPPSCRHVLASVTSPGQVLMAVAQESLVQTGRIEPAQVPWRPYPRASPRLGAVSRHAQGSPATAASDHGRRDFK